VIEGFGVGDSMAMCGLDVRKFLILGSPEM
jgi:hypothetical protein